LKAALQLRGVRKQYGKVAALDGLSFSVPRGAISGFIGPNGAGKTTTFGVVGGTIRPDAGTVDLLGAGPFSVEHHRGRVTLLPQDCELNPHTPVRALLLFYGRLQGMGAAEAEREADRVLDDVELRDRADQRIHQLSHGMRRRVAVAQALLGAPELILLDEPTSGLDPHLVARLREVLSRARGKSTLIISSHVLVELEAICDHVVFIERGRLVKEAPLGRLEGARPAVRVRFAGSLPALETALDGLPYTVHADVLRVEGPPGGDVPALNARALPRLIAAGLQIVEVLRGQSLEETYLEARAAHGPKPPPA
jgi:ABC-2 type transport system ATP-binding protein